jgi:hypothetical protein
MKPEKSYKLTKTDTFLPIKPEFDALFCSEHEIMIIIRNIRNIGST